MHLTKKAKKKIDKFLKGESLAFVSTFADQIKSDKKYNKYYSWHYVNMPLNVSYEDSEKNPEGDIVTGIHKCIEVLKSDTSSTEDKVFFLKMLVHFLGDLHQPMHIGRAEDKGGNTVQVQWFGRGTNLHRVWDSDMIESWNMSYTELAVNAKKISNQQVSTIKQGDLMDWVYESQELSKKVYKSVKSEDKLGYNYSYENFSTARSQLQKAGIRLAKVLNEIYG